jgi:hypothetical protein
MDLFQLQAELQRLADGPRPNETPSGIGLARFVVRCPSGAADILAKVATVLKIVDEIALAAWPNTDEWRRKLPEWFTLACAPQISDEQAERWLAWWKALPQAEQAWAELEKDWSLDNWLYWMQPDNRQWFWWHAQPVDGDHIKVMVSVDAWPFPYGSLRWLFKAAGAVALAPED